MLHLFCSLSAFIVALGILITVHEFGHFWMARRCGVMVECFSIGFGRTIWHWYDKNGTEYIIAAIPLGGYVKMLDGCVDSVALDHRHKAFNYKTIWQRIMIIVAGPVFNFMFAIFAYWLVFLIGVTSYRPVIGEVIPHSIAAQAELSPGMELKSIDDIPTPDWDTVRLQLINKIGNSDITIGVTLLGSYSNDKKILHLRDWQFEPSKQDVIVALGIIPVSPSIEPVLVEILSGSAAMKAGLQAGDRIVKVDGQPVASWQLFVNHVRDNPDRPLRVSIYRHGAIKDIILQPDSQPVGRGKVKGFAGIVPKMISLPAEYKSFQQYGPLLAMIQAGEKTWQLTKITVSMLFKLITGDINLNNLSGPISIAKYAGISAEYGFVYYLMFLALISINLGILNLFPLPVLDGGHLLFLMIEQFKKEPLSEQVQNFSYRIGSILLMLLMGLAIFNDLSRF